MATRLSDSAVFHGQSFQDMIAPLKEYREAYKEVEQAYDTVSQSTAGIRDLISPERDSATYERYMNYANRLNETVDDFAKGMSMGNRAALLGLKRDYASEIVPINTAIAKRNALADEQRETRRKDQTAIFQRDANTISLDRFMENPQTDYGGVIYGDNIREDVRKMAKNLAKEISGNPEMQKLFPYAYNVITQKGYNSGEIYKYIMNGASDDERKRILDSLVSRAVAASGVEGWNDPNAVRQVGDYAVQGLWDAIGEPDVKQLYDKYNMQLALMDEQARRAAATTTTEEEAKVAATKNYLYSKSKDEVDNVARQIQEWKEKGYLKENKETGTLEITEEGKNKMKEEEEKIQYSRFLNGSFPTTAVTNYQPNINTPLTTMYNAVKALNNGSDENLSDAMKRWLQSNSLDALGNSEYDTDYDTNRVPEYSVQIDSTISEDWIKAIATAAKDNKIPIVKFNGKTQKYEKTDKEITSSDLNSCTVVGSSYGPAGNVINLLDKEGKPFQIFLSLLGGAPQRKAIDNMLLGQNKIFESIRNDKGKIDEKEYKNRQDNYEELGQNIGKNVLDLVRVNKVKENNLGTGTW